MQIVSQSIAFVNTQFPAIYGRIPAMQSDFIKWLTMKLEDISMTQVARRSGGKVSQATISRILSGKQRPTCDVCIGIADGLGEPRHLVLEIAGILEMPPNIDLTAQQLEWLQLFDKLSDSGRADILDMARLKVSRERRARYSANEEGGAP